MLLHRRLPRVHSEPPSASAVGTPVGDEPPRQHLTKTLVRYLVPRGLRRRIWSYVVDRRTLARMYYALDPDMRPLRLTRKTDIVIDGFFRCANTYAVFAFKHANSEAIHVAHHLHQPLTFERAASLEVPALLVIRPPGAVLASALQFEPGTNAAAVLSAYSQFYERLTPILDHVVVAVFSEVTSDFGRVVRRVNARFGTDFTPYVRSEASESAVMAAVERFSYIHYAREDFESKVSRPSVNRRGPEEFVASLGPDDRRELDRAGAVYDRVVARGGRTSSSAT